MGVAVFRRDWIIEQTLAILEDLDVYSPVSPWEMLNHLNTIHEMIEEFKLIHLQDQKQLSKFISHCVPKYGLTRDWEKWTPFIPEMYAIPKIHKNPWKGRPICPGYNLPQNAASKVLSKVVRPFLNNVPWIIQGSKDFVRKLKDVKIPANKKVWIVCADMVAFYPSIPIPEALAALEWFTEQVLITGDLEPGQFNTPAQAQQKCNYYKRLFAIALKEPVMTYMHKMFVQHKGLPMGAAGSPDVANMYGYFHERFWIVRFQQSENLLFYGRFLDDIFTLVAAKTADEARTRVSFIKLGSVQLLWEEPALTVNFLDLTVTIQENGVIHHQPFVKSMSHRE